MPAYSAFFGNIPQKHCRLHVRQSNNYFSAPQSKIVRVAIGDQNFSKYEHETVAIYGTGEFEVYNNENYINTFDSENVINISMVGKIFVLTDAENNVIAKVSGPIIFKTDYGFIGVKGLKRGGKCAYI